MKCEDNHSLHGTRSLNLCKSEQTTNCCELASSQKSCSSLQDHEADSVSGLVIIVMRALRILRLSSRQRILFKTPQLAPALVRILPRRSETKRTDTMMKVSRIIRMNSTGPRGAMTMGHRRQRLFPPGRQGESPVALWEGLSGRLRWCRQP